MESRRILVFAPHFSPGFKAGGTLRSLVGIVGTAPSCAEVLVITSDRDLGDLDTYPGLSGTTRNVGSAMIHYMDVRRPGHWLRAIRLARAFAPDVVYLNSLWHRPFAVVPAVLLSLRLLPPTYAVIAPRGQLATSALGTGSRHVKRVALRLWRWWLHGDRDRRIVHCTDESEQELVRGAFGDVETFVSMDPVDLPLQATPPPTRPEGPLRAVFIGRVARVKNLHTLLTGLAAVNHEVHVTIIGPLEDECYANELRCLVETLPARVSVELAGPVPPSEVRAALASADVFLFPTLGENFGHAVAEALASSCPVVCGAVTPFTEVLRAGGGEVLDNHTDPAAWAAAIDRWCALSPDGLAKARAKAGSAYSVWRSSRDTSHVFDLALSLAKTKESPPPIPPSATASRIDFLTYSSRSGSTFLARTIDCRYDVLVVPETQCLYHALVHAPISSIAPDVAARMVQEDNQLYWCDDEAIRSLRDGPALTPAAFTSWVCEAYARHLGLPIPPRILVKLGGALHIWPRVQACLPDARAVDIVRDGRAVVNSALRTNAPYLSSTTLALDDVIMAARTWRRDVRVAERLIARGYEIHQIRYEQLVANVDRTLAHLASALGWASGGAEGFAVHTSESQIHKLVDQGAVNDRLTGWRSELHVDDRVVVERLCRSELQALGISDFLTVTSTYRARIFVSAVASHLAIQTRFGLQRVRRIRNASELRRKITYRLLRATASRGPTL